MYRSFLCVVSLVMAVACGGSTPEAEFPENSSSGANDQGAVGDEPAVESWDEPAESAVGDEATDEDDEESDAVGDEEANARPLGATVEETRTSEVIRDVVLKHRQAVRDCYEVELKKTPNLRGTLTLTFRISAKGDVQSVTLNEERSTLKQPELVNCAVSAMSKLKFPPSSRGFESTVNYPFDFKP